MTNISALLAEKRGTPTETAETDARHGLLRRRRVVTGWTVRAYVPEVENALGHIMPDDSWSKEQIRDWRQAYERLEADTKPSETGLFLSDTGALWSIDWEGRLWPPGS
jgi:hypothetical protein